MRECAKRANISLCQRGLGGCDKKTREACNSSTFDGRSDGIYRMIFCLFLRGHRIESAKNWLSCEAVVSTEVEVWQAEMAG